MRRFTRLTNAFSKKVENLQAAVALHFAHYNLVRLHKTLRDHSGHGGWRDRSGMVARGIGGANEYVGDQLMFFLVCKIDPTNQGKVLKEPVLDRGRQAISRARGLLASGEALACVLEDDNGTVADDAEVLERCKTSN